MTLPTISRAMLGVNGRKTVRQYMQPGEQEVLLALVFAAAPKIMVEVGVNEGLTAKAVLDNVVGIERYIGIDVDPDYQFEIAAQAVERPVHPGLLVRDDPRFHLWISGSPSAVMTERADVVFIDGDHGRQAVLTDSIWAAAVVPPGGLIIWHDYGNPTVEVTQVLDVLRAQGRDIRRVEGTWLAFEWR
jgi:predicted O-methyltransferase YrrM